MTIRKAEKKDIPFIVDAMIEVEKIGDTNTFNNLFGTTTEESKNYLEQFLLDDENLHTEFSLNTYSVVELDGELAACCCIFFTNFDYYQNKSELFPIHLNKDHLAVFIENVKSLPNTKQISENKHFIEYIYTNPMFRGQGVAKKMIDYQIEKIQDENMYINVLENNLNAINYYKKLGFVQFQSIAIDSLENKIYPCKTKIILTNKN